MHAEVHELLWDRVESNRRKLVVWAVLFVVTTVASAVFVLGVLPLAWLVLTEPEWTSARTVLVSWFLLTAAGGLLTAGSFVAYAVITAPRRLLATMAAVRADPGRYRRTYGALEEMSLAAGLAVPPPLLVAPLATVNAAGLGGPSSARMVVTEGLASQLPAGEQRAVFANLLARVLSGDTLLATARAGMGSYGFASRRAAGELAEHSVDWFRVFKGRGCMFAGALMLAQLVVSAAAAVTSIVCFGFLSDTRGMIAETADAEGMLLLRDPGAMLAALERIRGCDTSVGPIAGLGPAEDDCAALFFAWPLALRLRGEDPDELRAARLREVVGAEGVS